MDEHYLYKHVPSVGQCQKKKKIHRKKMKKKKEKRNVEEDDICEKEKESKVGKKESNENGRSSK